MLWHTMNQVLLFEDDADAPYVIRIVGRDALKYFEKSGYGEHTLDDEYVQAYFEMKQIEMEGKDEWPKEELDLKEIGVPRYAVNIGDEKEPKVVTKMRTED